MNSSPRSLRLHIGVFGNVNTGKSSFINAITNQEVSLTSNVAGTTTDPVYKAMELSGIGPVVWIDTAGIQDTSVLGLLRLEKTQEAATKSDIAVLLFDSLPSEEDLYWLHYFKEKKTPVLLLLSKIDLITDPQGLKDKIEELTNEDVHMISNTSKEGLDQVRGLLIEKLPKDYDEIELLEGFVNQGDLVLLVMPQDIQAPKGRLILPQVQTIRNALDRKCTVVSCGADTIEQSLSVLNRKPDLVICDSQIVKLVKDSITQDTILTTFSVLFANFKGEAKEFRDGVKILDSLQGDAKILIAEACTHAPLEEDIGRVKIPNLLRKRYGENIVIDMHSGTGFPDNLSEYDLIIHCGACMFNRKHVLSRMEEARKNGVGITNYGMTLAYLQGVLEDVKIK